MANHNIYVDPEDPQVLLGEYNFENEYFNLEETDIPTINSNKIVSYAKVKNDFRPFKNNFKFGHINARSIPKSIDELNHLMYETELDILAISETWLHSNIPISLFEIPGYDILRKDRTSKRGGGIAFYAKQHFKPKIIKTPHDLEQPELLFIELQCKNIKVAMGVLYKAPNIKYGVFATLHETFADILCKYDNTFVFGDFNIDCLDTNSCATKFLYSNIIEPFDLKQIVTGPTRVTDTSAKLLDLALVSNPSTVKMVGTTDLPGISDHSMIYLSCSIKKPKHKPNSIWCRDYSKMDRDSFKRDAASATWENVYMHDELSVNDKVTAFNSIINDLFDKHAPYKKITFSKFGRKPKWLTEEISILQGKRDLAFDEWKGNPKNVKLKNTYKTLKNIVNQKSRNSKVKMFNEEINSKIKNAKQFWKAADVLGIHKTNENKANCKIDPNILNQKFVSNNNTVTNENAIDAEMRRVLDQGPNIENSFQFMQISEEEIRRLVKSLKYTAGGHDNVTAKMIKLVIPFAITAITNIINSSLASGVFPSQWKNALVIPIPKIPNPRDPSDFRPISLLPTLSKILEKVVAKQVLHFLYENNLMEPLQSGFKIKHGCDTALLKITDDIYSSIDASELSLMVLLDFSKAFDTVNHKLLLTKLLSMGFNNNALSWFGSYLSDRFQKVKSNDKVSDWSSLKNGVPQGYILGPLLFTILAADFRNCLKI